MLKVARFVAALCVVALSLSLVACSSENDPAIVVTMEFIKKAATGDKTLKDIVDFESAMNKYGSSEKDVLSHAGAAKWEGIKTDMINTIFAAFSPLKNTYQTAFKDFKVDEKGVDYWIVSYQNPAKERKRMKVKKIDGKLRAYYY
jgi:hypothetical protein